VCADSAQAAAVVTISVEVVYASAPHHVERVPLQLPAGATARDALRASGLALRPEAGVLDTLVLGLSGRVCGPATVLREHDRLELLRPLQVDPKEARRLRYRRDGLKKVARSR
jgi:putative ubiquitin-RnfH superfamily antitoxin RatB of RatAB toxin-antitoxin module